MKLATAGNKENLQDIINKYFYSDNYVIDDNNNIINLQNGKQLENFKVDNKKGRWIFSNTV